LANWQVDTISTTTGLGASTVLNFFEVSPGSLMLSHGQLNDFPAGFRNLKNLKLSSQKPDSSVVFRLPEDLYLNTNLENLELGFTSQFSQNSLFEFLSNFEPTKPFSLNLVDMGITELPEGDFWQKIKWGSIELTSNQLNKLPASWKNLKNFGRDSTKKEFTGNFLNKFYKNIKNVPLFLHFLYLMKH
jgi:hypothetical protein